MQANITIAMDNAAFAPDDEDASGAERNDTAAGELSRILADAAKRCRLMSMDGRSSLKLRDANGNTVGELSIEPDA